jgi:peptidoglycan/xylan/chitin deacetylase (PgdA/CDA1 family)
MRLANPQHGLPPEAGPKAVALTFDDGPDAEYTPQVLELLAEHGVVATFFCVGKRTERHPELVRRMVAEGHAVGSHSWSHRDAWTLPWRVLTEDYRAGRHALERVVGRRVTLFRPPKGHLDARGALAIRAAGLRPWLWTVSPEDWQPGVTPEDMLERLRGLAGRDVVLLHDGLELPIAPEALDRSATVDLLPDLVALARERGLTFVTLDGTNRPAGEGARAAAAP